MGMTKQGKNPTGEIQEISKKDEKTQKVGMVKQPKLSEEAKLAAKKILETA